MVQLDTLSNTAMSEIPLIPLKGGTDPVTLLAQADLLLLIAQLFAPPSAEMREMLATEVQDINELLHKSGIPNPQPLDEIFQHFRQQAQILSLEKWAEEYNRLFEGNVSCPINESGFIRRDKGVILADIAGFYRAFGFELADETHEKGDHLRVELEFVALLLVMLAKAEKEAIRTTHEALESFSFDHLGEWLPAFCERLTPVTTLPLYQHLAKLTLEAWSGIVTVNNLPVSEGNLMDKVEVEETPYECGMIDA